MFNKTKFKQFSWFDQPGITLGLLVLVILFIRLFLRGQMLELDEAEQVVMAQHLSPGYPDQPPLYSWLQYGFFQLFGCSLLSLALLKSLLIFGCLYVYHQICRIHCQSKELAWCATVSWALIPAISFDLIKDNTHSVLALFSASLTWYWFVAPSRLAKTTWYLILGSILGVGFLSKFNYLLFLAILFFSSVSISDYRNKLVNRKIILTVFLSFLIASPYVIWLQQHFSLGFRSVYKLAPEDKQQWKGLAEFISIAMLFIIPNFIVATLYFPIKFKLTQHTAPNSLLVRYHLISLPFLILVFLLLGIKNFETRWLIPILFLCPLLYLGQVKPTEHLTKKIKLFLALCLFVQLGLFIGLLYRSHNSNKLSNQFSLEKIVQNIKNEHQKADYIVSDSHWLLGNLMLNFPTTGGWLLHPANQPRLPNGKSLLIWQNAPLPFWINYFAQIQHLNKIKYIKDLKQNKIIAGYTYLENK